MNLFSSIKENTASILRDPRGKIKSLYRISLYRNAAYLMLTWAIGPILGFIFWVVVARYTSSSELGLANALTAAIGMLIQMATFGLHIGLIRFLSEERDKRGIINSCLTISGVSSLVLAAIFIVGLNVWMPKLLFLRADLTLLLAFILFTVISIFYLMERHLFIALRSTHFNFILQVIMHSSRIAVIAILFALGATRGVSSIFLSWGIATGLVVIIGGFFIRRLQPGYYPLPIVKKRLINNMVRFSSGNYVADLVATATVYILPLMVLSVLSAQDNAYFFLAFTIASAVYLAPTKAAMALFAEGANDPEQLRTNIMRYIKLMCVLIPIALAIVFLLGDKILLLIGKEYSEGASKLLLMLALMGIPLIPYELYIAVKRIQKKIRPIIYLNIFSTAFALGASYLLMHKFGLIGVGIANLSVMTIIGITLTIIMLREFYPLFRHG